LTLAKQQETIDRLTVAQQRLEAIVVQSYELLKYPIPRLFVILPESYEKWDPRGLVMERFRLFFLCECGDHCRPDIQTSTTTTSIEAAATGPPNMVKSSVHLAKHDGYELSRPTEFFDRYGPYVLGTLKVLKHCLSIAMVVAPAVALVVDGVKDTIEVVKSISESTLEAVNSSIGFLEQKLERGSMADGVTRGGANSQEEDMFQDLAALEGADLRRLDFFYGTRTRI